MGGSASKKLTSSIDSANLMEFDERLQRTFESLTARLQQEIAAQLNAAGAELSAGPIDRDS